MRPAPAQLEALAAIVDHGTFDAAARALHVTPSAISQRVRALESAAGQVLVRRTTPCRPTPAGETLVRLARQTALLQAEAAAELGAGAPSDADAGLDGVNPAPVVLSVAVSADALATWFRAVLARAAGWRGAALRLHVEDQAYSADLLRRGDVLGAVTSDPTPVQGCTSEPLGVLRYYAAASPALAARVETGRWSDLPVVVFNEKDALQREALDHLGVDRPDPAVAVHRVPTSADFAEAVRVGLGWGMLPAPQLEPLLADREVVVLDPRPVDVALHWQRWRLDAPMLTRLTDAVRRAAHDGLSPEGAG